MQPTNKPSACRVCLKCDSKQLINSHNIFDGNNHFSIYEELNEIASIKIKPEDGLPDRICNDCLKELQNVLNFRRKCQDSNYILLTNAFTLCQDKEQQVVKKTEPLNDEDQDYTGYDEIDGNIYIKSENIGKVSKESNESTVANSTIKTIETTFQCHDCNEVFKSKCKLRVHWKKIHLPQHLTCPLCKRELKTYKSFHSHMRKNSRSCITASKVRIEGTNKSRKYYCKDCEYSSGNIRTMAAHLVTHTGERPFVCNLCPKTFTQQSTLQAHQEAVHKNYIKLSTCHVCGKFIKGRKQYYLHMLKHTNCEFKCKLCNKTVSTRNNLVNHMKRHTETKSHCCDKCPLTFYTRGELSNHLKRVHYGNQTYKCDICEYKNKHKHVVLRHQSKHTHQNAVCLFCGKFYESQAMLEIHKKSHTGKNYTCLECCSKFSSKKSLWSHVSKKHRKGQLNKQSIDNSKLANYVVKVEMSA